MYNMDLGNDCVRSFLSYEELVELRKLCPLDRVVDVGLNGWGKELNTMPQRFGLQTIGDYLISTGNVLEDDVSVTYDTATFRQYRCYPGYKSFVAGNVKRSQFNSLDENEHFCLLHGFVLPSQSVDKQPYRSIVVIHKNTGRPCMAYCQCTASRRENCSHVAALLFQAEYCISTTINLPSESCSDQPVGTEKLCEWVKPAVQKLQIKEVGDLEIKKVKLSGKPSTKPSVHFEEDYYSVYAVPDLTLAQFVKFRQKMQHVNPTCPFATHFTTPLSQAKLISDEDIPYTNEESVVLEPNGMPTEGQIELQEHIKVAVCPISGSGPDLSKFPVFEANETEEIRKSLDIEIATVGQSSSNSWLDKRRGLITSSIMHKVLSRRETTQPNNLVATINGNKVFPQTKAMKSGLGFEKDTCCLAVEKIQILEQAKVKMRLCGLIVNPKWPFLGASPDRELELKYEDGRVEVIPLEVKSPCDSTGLSRYPGTIHQLANEPKGKKFLAHDITDNLYLKLNSDYGMQMLGQIALTESKFGYFAVATAKEVWVEKVFLNVQQWNDVFIPKLQNFYEQFIKPQ